VSKRHRADRAAAPGVVTHPRRHPASPFPRRIPRTPVQELRSLGRVRQSLAVRERAAVVTARLQGMTWAEIAEALDLPVPTVHRRYR
jgi:DNA-directed RNA polymerase specialized sigma24 family protein